MNTEARKSILDLLAVMAALRTPKSGCPWDLAQNFKSIAPYTIEEAYEVADAITRKMIRRHPHVFGTAAERAAGAAPGFWERAKAAERHGDREAEASIL